MKKPNISKGGWSFNIDCDPHSDWTIRTDNHKDTDMMGDYRGCIIADLKPAHGGRYHAYAEAKANGNLLAASKEMMNDLIDAYEKLLNLKLTHGHLVNQKQLEKMESTLRKAGVKFESEKAIQ